MFLPVLLGRSMSEALSQSLKTLVQIALERMVVSGHDHHGKQAMDRGEKVGHTSFILRDKWYISREGNKEIRTTRE